MVRNRKRGEVVLMTYNRTRQIWRTAARAVRSAQALVQDDMPFTATITPISRKEALAMVDAGKVNYCDKF
jgi:hypothetical protein